MHALKADRSPASAIRLATESDVMHIVDMVETLRTAVNGPVPVDRAHTAATVARLIASADGFVAVAGDGFIAGALVPTIINPTPVAQELGWFSASRTGLSLLRAFEVWARDRGALLIQLSTGPDGLDLTRLGYRRAELAWVK